VGEGKMDDEGEFRGLKRKNRENERGKGKNDGHYEEGNRKIRIKYVLIIEAVKR